MEEEGKTPDELTSSMIINCAIDKNDPLCLKVVDKFTEILGVEAGNFALKILSFGGIYLVGGVTEGIFSYLEHSDTFVKNFEMKGRLENTMK